MKTKKLYRLVLPGEIKEEVEKYNLLKEYNGGLFEISSVLDKKICIVKSPRCNPFFVRKKWLKEERDPFCRFMIFVEKNNNEAGPTWKEKKRIFDAGVKAGMIQVLKREIISISERNEFSQNSYIVRTMRLRLKELDN